MVWEGLVSNFWTKKHLSKFFQTWICVFRLLEKGLWNWTGPRPGPFLNDFDHSLLRFMAYINDTYIVGIKYTVVFLPFSCMYIVSIMPHLFKLFCKGLWPVFSKKKKTINQKQQLKKGVSPYPWRIHGTGTYIYLHPQDPCMVDLPTFTIKINHSCR